MIGEPHPEIRLFEQQPAAWSQPRHHAGQEASVDWDMHQDGPGVDKVKRSLRKVIDADVMVQYFDVPQVQGFKEAHLQIGGDDRAWRPDELGKPPCDRSSSTTDLKTAGAFTDAETLDAAPS